MAFLSSSLAFAFEDVVVSEKVRKQSAGARDRFEHRHGRVVVVVVVVVVISIRGIHHRRW